MPMIIIYASEVCVPYGIANTNPDAWAEVEWWERMRALRCSDSYWIVPGTIEEA